MRFGVRVAAVGAALVIALAGVGAVQPASARTSAKAYSVQLAKVKKVTKTVGTSFSFSVKGNGTKVSRVVFGKTAAKITKKTAKKISVTVPSVGSKKVKTVSVTVFYKNAKKKTVKAGTFKIAVKPKPVKASSTPVRGSAGSATTADGVTVPIFNGGSSGSGGLHPDGQPGYWPYGCGTNADGSNFFWLHYFNVERKSITIAGVTYRGVLGFAGFYADANHCDHLTTLESTNWYRVHNGVHPASALPQITDEVKATQTCVVKPSIVNLGGYQQAGAAEGTAIDGLRDTDGSNLALGTLWYIVLYEPPAAAAQNGWYFYANVTVSRMDLPWGPGALNFQDGVEFVLWRCHA